jgi:translation initiation factor IF-2
LEHTLAKKPPSLRVHQLAKELGVDSKAIVSKCQAEEIPGIENYMSTVSLGLAATIREWFSAAHSHNAVEQAAPVDVAAARSTARKRPSRSKKSAHGDGAGEGPADSATAIAEPPAKSRPASRSRSQATDDLTDDEGAIDAPVVEAIAPTSPNVASPAAPDAGKAAARAPADGKAVAKPRKPVEPTIPPPQMNVPVRPDVVKPAGPMLQKPVRTQMKGPKVIRVEAPEVLPAPRARSTGPGAGSISRGGPRAGRGAGGMPETDFGRSGDRTGAGSRRNKRRSASAFEEGAAPPGRTGRLAHATSEEQARHFDWREQDLIERENRLNRSTGFFKAARRDNIKRATGGGHRATVPAQTGGKVQIQTPISIKDLSAATGVKVSDIIKKLFLAGKAVTVNSILDSEAAMEAVLDYGIELDIQQQKTAEQKITEQFQQRVATDERRRSPVVTILGHVDHGKTSLLDKIRNTNVAAGEAGGITQATSAFQVPVHVGDNQHVITFIDTPGHEAFTEMRARGAKVTDVVVLVVAADDGVMPQTVESINHAKAAGVPIVVALNKIDKPEATDSNIQRILGELAGHELNPAEWGGTTEVVRTSATKGTGIQDLLEVLDYQAQLLNLTADYGGLAEGTVLEASMAEGRGAVARVIVQQGTLRIGDHVTIGRAFGRIRDIVNDRGQRIEEAGPSMPVAFSGINDVPDAGDKFYAVKDLAAAEDASRERLTAEREKSLAKEKITLSNVFEHLSAAHGNKKELPLIVKADVQGSLETLRAVLGRIASDDVEVSLKHTSVGGVNESDVTLAEAAGAIIVGFNVTASAAARKLAENKGVDIRFYDVIYQLTDDVKAAAEGLLEPELRLEVIGHAEVRQVFKISKVGMIAGCYVTDGVIERNSQIRVTRGGVVVEKDRRLEQLKRFKDDAKEVRAGQECGMKIDGYDDIKEGDILECYKTREVARKL